MVVAVPRKRIAPERAGVVGHLRVANLEIDALTPRIRQGQRVLGLSPYEHVLLYLLAANAGAVVGQREIGKALGSAALEGRHNSLARHVSSLRRKLGDSARNPRYIETVPGIGYRFVGAREKEQKL